MLDNAKSIKKPERSQHTSGSSKKNGDKENSKINPRRSAKKARPAPDFSKLHQSWESKFMQGKAMTKKPLTQVQPFELSDPSALPHKVKQKLDFEKSTLLTSEETGTKGKDEFFETSPRAKEKLLNSPTLSSEKSQKSQRSTIAAAPARRDIPSRGRPTSFYTNRSSFLCGSQSSSAIKSTRGFQKIEVEFKPDPESLKSIFVEPGSSPHQQCQEVYRRSTFTGKMRAPQLGGVTGRKRMSIYDRYKSKTSDMTYKEFIENLKKSTLAMQAKRLSAHQNMPGPFNSLKSQLAELSNGVRTTIRETTIKSKETVQPSYNFLMPKPSLFQEKSSTLVGFQGEPTSVSSTTNTQDFIRQVNAKESISSRPDRSETKFSLLPKPSLPLPFTGQNRFQTTVASFKKPGTGLGISVGRSYAGSRLNTSVTTQSISKSSLSRSTEKVEFAEDKQVSGSTREKEGVTPPFTRSALKKKGQVETSESKRKVHWSDVLAVDQERHQEVGKHVSGTKSNVVSNSSSTAKEQPQAKKSLQFNPSADKEKIENDTRHLQDLNVTVIDGTPCSNKQGPSLEVTTPITAEEIRRRGIDPFSFNLLSPGIIPGLPTSLTLPEKQKVAKEAEEVTDSDSQDLDCLSAREALKCPLNGHVRRRETHDNSAKIIDSQSQPKYSFGLTSNSLSTASNVVTSAVSGVTEGPDVIYSRKPSAAQFLEHNIGSYGNFKIGFETPLRTKIEAYIKHQKSVTNSVRSSVYVGSTHLPGTKGHNTISALSEKAVDWGSSLPTSKKYDSICNVAKCSEPCKQHETKREALVSSPVLDNAHLGILVTPPCSSPNYLDSSLIYGCPSRLRHKARTPHAKGDVRDADKREDIAKNSDIQTDTIIAKAAELKLGNGEVPVKSKCLSSPKCEVGEKSTAECSKTIDQFFSATKECRTAGSAITTEIDPSMRSDTWSNNKSQKTWPSLWTKVPESSRQRYFEVTSQGNSRFKEVQALHSYHQVGDSPLLDLEVSLICQKIEARRRMHQFTPIRGECSNPVAKSIMTNAEETISA